VETLIDVDRRMPDTALRLPVHQEDAVDLLHCDDGGWTLAGGEGPKVTAGRAEAADPRRPAGPRGLAWLDRSRPAMVLVPPGDVERVG